MPMVIVHTSVKEADIPQGFEGQLAAKVAEVLLKPITKMNVVIHPGVRLYRKESNAPACVVQIYSIGVFDAARNPTYTPPIIEFIRSQLKLGENRLVTVIHPGVRLYRKESYAPACVVQIYSIGVFDSARNPTYTPPIIEFIRSQLKLGENRVVIHYREAELYQFGQ